MSDPILVDFVENYGLDPFSIIYMVDDDNAALNGMFKQPIVSAVLEWLDEEPDFDVRGYVQAWKEYWISEGILCA